MTIGEYNLFGNQMLEVNIPSGNKLSYNMSFSREDLSFTEMVKELSSLALYGTGVEIILQLDLNTLIKASELANELRDISWLKEQIKGNIFDLYGVLTIDDKKYCFGCVQAKTSIRDRVTRDREPSIHAMQSFFWSVVFVEHVSGSCIIIRR